MPIVLRPAIALLSLTTLLAACQNEPANTPRPAAGPAPEAGAAAPAGEAAAPDIQTRLAQADPSKGEVLYLQCRACHSLKADEPNKVGPNLHGLFGASAGFAPGFAYSEALSKSGVVWTPETLDPWLARPSEFIPGNRMVFVGIPNPQDRANLIAWLQQQTNGSPQVGAVP